MDAVLRDLRFAFRVLAKRPVYTVAALLALGLGVGANTAIFSVFDAVLLEPVGYPQADRLVRIWETNPGKDIDSSRPSPVTFHDFRETAASFQHLTGWWHPDLNLTSGEGEPLRVEAINVTDDFFDTLGVQPALGRGFVDGEDESGQPRIAVVGHELWQRRYGGDPRAVGGAVTLDGLDYTLVGVMPEGFSFPGDTEIWLPLGWNPSQHSRGARFFHVAGRLAEGVSLAAAGAEVDALMTAIARDYAETNEGWGARVVLLEHDLVGDVRQALWVLLGAVGLVLLVACANVANLLLAQAAARRREVAVRSALGAGRGRLFRQFLSESLVLAFLGAVAGLVIAFAGVRVLVSLAPPEIPRLDGAALDFGVLLFTLAVTALSGLLFGLAPALTAIRGNFGEALKEGGRSGASGAGGHRLRQALVVSEVALALILLFGAGLLVRSFYRLLDEAPGFNPRHTLSFNVQLPRTSYADWTDVTAFYGRLIDRLETVSGVEDAAVTAFLPLEVGWRVDFSIAGLEGLNDRDRPEAQYHTVSPGYFQLMGIPLLRGRDFDSRDDQTMPGAVILNRAAVERYWGGEDPLGKVVEGQARQFGPLGRVLTESLAAEIVGIVGDVKNTALEDPPEPAMYFSQRQFAYRAMSVLAKATGDPEALLQAVKAAVWDLDPNLPIARLGTLEEHLGAAVARRRFVMLLLSCFAGLSLALASIGTYGVMSQIAGERRREIGVRMALGARRGDIVSLMMGKGFRWVAAGIVVGLAGIWALHRFMASLVFGVGTTDLWSLLAVVAVIATAGLAACVVPARRASRAEPVTVLREE
ncbi:MAG: ABC transporter permease [Thermoanaerobaculia bacterium]